MNSEVVIDEKDLVAFIIEKSGISEEDVVKVLDLEFEFLKEKGVVE